MVTSVSSNSQVAYVSIATNTQKASNLSNKESATEGAYIPSYNLNNTGVDFYKEQWEAGGIGMHLIKQSTSLNEFTQSLKSFIARDYKEQYPNSDINIFNPGEQLQGYLNTIDYKKEYEEYKQSRGCNNDEELAALSQTPFQNKEQLIDSASTRTRAQTYFLYEKGFSSQSPDGVNFNSIIGNLNLNDISSYFNSDNSAQNVQERFDGLQSFFNTISQQNNLDGTTKGIFSGFLNDITNSKDGIAEYSKKIEEENAAQANINKYNSSLISKYAS